MLRDMCSLFLERREFFLKLLWEHLEIAMISILIAIVFGGLVGILISEYQQSAKPAMGVINFLYTIPSISMLGFLIPFSGVGNMTAVIALTIYALLPMVRKMCIRDSCYAWSIRQSYRACGQGDTVPGDRGFLWRRKPGSGTGCIRPSKERGSVRREHNDRTFTYYTDWQRWDVYS